MNGRGISDAAFDTSAIERRLKGPLRLTRMGMIAERILRSFWPFVSVTLATLAALMLGIQDALSLEFVWIGGVIAVAGSAFTLFLGVRRFRLPTASEVTERLDSTLPGRPITAFRDTQAIGTGDTASEAIWRAHVARMAARAGEAKAAQPDLRLSTRDPYALRYAALLAFIVALIFGSVLRVGSVAEMTPGAGGERLAMGPAWEGWVEPPGYTGRPSLYLNDITDDSFSAPEGSRITLRLYGEVGELTVDETVSGRTGELPPASATDQSFELADNGRLAIRGPGGREWDVDLVPDEAPVIFLSGDLERSSMGELRQGFSASDDYGVVAGRATISLDLPQVDRRHGLAPDPQPRSALVLDLPLTISGNRAGFEETLVDDVAKHPWAGLPVTLTLEVTDAAGNTGTTGQKSITLPERRFIDPLAAAVAEQRRDLLWSDANAQRITEVLRAATYRPEGLFPKEITYLKLRTAIRRMEAALASDTFDLAFREETAEVLWQIAVEIEEGDLSDALERLRRAQERVADAIRNGATDEEIDQLMRELAEAMQDYMRQLAQQQMQDGQPPQTAENQQGQTITGDQLQEMLNRLQELMEQGRMAEAQQLLEQLRQMMENMQIAQGQPGQGQPSPGQQAMEGLGETLREQQDLSDETFRDLQDQFGDGEQSGGEMSEGELSERQRQLREELRRQSENLPGAGTPEGDAARESLDRAERAMEGAEDALRNDDFAGALDDQSEAIEALRDGMRSLGEAMAEQNGQQDGQGQQMGQNGPDGQRDPLGRQAGRDGRLDGGERLLQDQDVYRRARELLDEIRRRSGDQSRPDAELDYLKRLLDRF